MQIVNTKYSPKCYIENNGTTKNKRFFPSCFGKYFPDRIFWSLCIGMKAKQIHTRTQHLVWLIFRLACVLNSAVRLLYNKYDYMTHRHSRQFGIYEKNRFIATCTVWCFFFSIFNANVIDIVSKYEYCVLSISSGSFLFAYIRQ